MNYWKQHFIKSLGVVCVLLITFIFGLLLNLLPLPYKLKWLMPNWLVLVLIYWIIFIPKLISIEFVFVLGIFIDLLLGNLLGITSLCLVSVAFVANLFCYRFRTFNTWQQFLMIALLVGIGQLIRLWVQLYINYPPSGMGYWITIVSSTMVWPLVCAWLHLFNKVIKFW